jgi:uncharacterized membrane protein
MALSNQPTDTDAPIDATAAVSAQQLDETSVLPSFAPEDEPAEARADEASAAPAAPAARTSGKQRFSWFAEQPMRLTLVVIIGVVALFFAFGLLIIFSPTNAAVSALAVIATPIASIVAAYYGITLSMQQVRDERDEKVAAVARAVAAETAAREADVWAAQMESGLRVAKVKLDAAGLSSDDVSKAAGVTSEFF